MVPGDLRLHVLLVLLLVGSQAFFTALAIRNVRHSASTIRAEADWLERELGVDDPEAVIDYTRAKTGLSLLQSWIGLAFLLIFLYAGIITAAVRVLEATGFGPIFAGTVFFVGLAILAQLYTLPFDAVDTFVIEELFDFNTQTPTLWLRDAVLGLAIGMAILTVLVAALLAFVEWLPAWWWLAGAAFFVAFGIVMQIVYPRVIAPLFNDFEPIEEGELRDGVEDVFDRAGFRCDELYTMDASRRSTHLNAYFVGFGRSKRVVLFDTLTEQLDLREIQSVLAHELAHWQRWHVWKRLGASSVRIAAALFILWWLIGHAWLYELFAVPEVAYAGLFIGVLFVSPLLNLSAPLENRLSLAHEREADRYAVDVMNDGEPMVNALARLASENLANPFPDPLYAAFHYTHPPIPERIRRIRDAEAA